MVKLTSHIKNGTIRAYVGFVGKLLLKACYKACVGTCNYIFFNTLLPVLEIRRNMTTVFLLAFIF